MTILTRKAHALTLIFAMVATALIMGMFSPLSAKAGATVSANTVLLYAMQTPGAPCNILDSGRPLGQPGLIRAVQTVLETQWNGKNTRVSYEEATAVTAIAILSSCPQYYGLAPTVDGVPYGPWVMIPTTSYNQSTFMAYWKGDQACGIATSSGVPEGVRFLMTPDDRIPYAISENDAKVGMLITAASRCPRAMGAVRAYLGG